MFACVQREGVLFVGVDVDQQRFVQLRRPQGDGEIVAVVIDALGSIEHERGR